MHSLEFKLWGLLNKSSVNFFVRKMHGTPRNRQCGKSNAWASSSSVVAFYVSLNCCGRGLAEPTVCTVLLVGSYLGIVCCNVSLEQSPCNGKGQRSLLTPLNMCLPFRSQERSVSFLPSTNILKSSKWKDNKNVLLSLLKQLTNNHGVVTIMKVCVKSHANAAIWRAKTETGTCAWVWIAFTKWTIIQIHNLFQG